MILTLELLLIAVAGILLTSIVTSKVAVRFGFPALLLFLILGMILGSEGPGGIFYDDAALTQNVGVIALVFILFAGGLTTDFKAVRQVAFAGVLLAVIGVFVTAGVVAWFAVTYLGFDWYTGILLGAILSPTDAAAVFSVLRGKGTQFKGQLRSIIELESGSNDPTAVFLTIGMIHLITQPAAQPIDLVPMFALQMAIGTLMGYLMAKFARFAINQARLEYDGLYPVLLASLVLMTYGITTRLGGNGFLAVYLTGLLLTRYSFIHKRSLVNFHDGIAWLMQIVMFLTLGLQVYPSELIAVAPQGILIALFLMLVARPLSVLVATLPTHLNLRERLLIAWVGLRGAAPIILATFPLIADVKAPLPIFDVVFFAVLVSVLVQGTTLNPIARLLRLTDEPEPEPLLPQILKAGHLYDSLLEVRLGANCAALHRQVLELGLPIGTLLLLIYRNGKTLTPNGSTQIEPHDVILIFAPPRHHERIRALFKELPSSGSLPEPSAQPSSG